MFGNKKLENKINELESKLDREVEDIYGEIDKLKCEHNNIVFVTPILSFSRMENYYRKKCDDCGKTLQKYETKKDWLIAKHKYYKNKIKGIEKELESDEDEE